MGMLLWLHDVNVNQPHLQGYDMDLEKLTLNWSGFLDCTVRNETIWKDNY